MNVDILTLKEYSRKFKVGNRYVSAETIKRMCETNIMPSWTYSRLIMGSSFGQGIWVIAVLTKKDS